MPGIRAVFYNQVEATAGAGNAGVGAGGCRIFPRACGHIHRRSGASRNDGFMGAGMTVLWVPE